jgi:hypothetical protein
MRKMMWLFLCFFVSLPLHAGEISDDHRVGIVEDVQGLVSVRPSFGNRWSPAVPGLVLKPGDWVKASKRGAHAARARLVDGTELVLGPGALLELKAEGGLRLTSGELQVTPPKDGSTELAGPGDSKLTIKRPTVVRTKDGLQQLKGKPKWLLGFEGAIVQESMGSLLATVDGREVPLTIGHHRVTVDIRDQIARTVIQESFVNHTDSQLEGVFYFPLPEDASISNFGMWIGSELVEADVVEKQRAREIFEIILREKRDPGLLEWSGGNLFKARVFPIFAHSEKRITITYTQVLPRNGNAYTYEYALRSEMLTANPLKELAIDVKIHSTLPLAGVKCPTHDVRSDVGEHAASLSFTAEEYRPENDFQVRISVPDDAPEIAVVPSRRDEDGYFMLLLSPRSKTDGDGRGLVPAGEPLQITIVADSSGSMDRAARQRQISFLESFLTSLGPEDKVRLFACDASCRALTPSYVAVNDDRIAEAMEFVAKQVPLGWTDLDAALESALEGAAKGDLLLYVGDGIPTAGEADVPAIAARIADRLSAAGVVGHAVAVSNQYEAQVLRAFAGTTGTWRRVSRPEEAPAAAAALLDEALGATLLGTTCRFDGAPVAQVYPIAIPAVAEGRQLVLLGRYLPGKNSRKLTINCQGTRAGKVVTFKHSVELPEEDAGNAFVPRLWARRYLDYLLEQGGAPDVKTEIIEMSEVYRIMTPYTSFLVLESDADRERFGVKRRFRMRDGEKFFAEGRKAADYELQRRHMLRAADWRIELQRSLAAQVTRLSRGISAWAGLVPRQSQFGYRDEMSGLGGMGKDFKSMDLLALPAGKSEIVLSEREIGAKEDFQDGEFDFDSDNMELSVNEPAALEDMPMDYPEAAPPPMEEMSKQPALSGKRKSMAANRLMSSPVTASRSAPKSGAFYSHALDGRVSAGESLGQGYWGGDFGGAVYGNGLMGWESLGGGGADWSRGPASGPQAVTWYEPYWFSQIFPTLSPAIEPAAKPAKRTKWNEQLEALSDSLYLRDDVEQLGTLKVNQKTSYYQVARQQLSGVYEVSHLLEKGAWGTRSSQSAEQTQIAWCDAEVCTNVSTAFQAGRTRKSNALDVKAWRLFFGDSSFTPWHDSYSPDGWTATLEEHAHQRVIALESKLTPGYKVKIAIDLRRNVVASTETWSGGVLAGRQEFSNHVEVAEGLWLPGLVEGFDAMGRRHSSQEYTFEVISPRNRSQAWETLKAGSEVALLLQSPMPTLLEAKADVKEAEPKLESLLRMALHFGQSQQWQSANIWLDRAQQKANGHAALRWLDEEVMLQERNQQVLKERFLGRARELQKDKSQNALFLAKKLLNNASYLYGEELLELLDLLEPTLRKAPAYTNLGKQLDMTRVNTLQNVGRSEESLVLLAKLAKVHLRAYDVQYAYISQLGSRGEYDVAEAWLKELLGKHGPWEYYEEEGLRGMHAQFLQDRGLFEKLLTYTKEWSEQDPKSVGPYQRYLSAMIYLGRPEDADKVSDEWLSRIDSIKDWQSPDGLRVQAAFYHGLGQDYGLYSNTTTPEWYPKLAAVAMTLASEPSVNHILWQLVSHQGFLASDVGKTFFIDLGIHLEKSLATKPVASLQLFLGWLQNAPVDQHQRIHWDTILKGLQKRWQKTEETQEELLLAAAIHSVFQNLGRTDEAVEFSRQRWQRAQDVQRAQMAWLYFEHLLSASWGEEREAVVLELLDELGGEQEKAAAHLSRVSALVRVASWMQSGRNQATIKAIKQPQEKSRTEMARLQRQALQDSRMETAKKLLAESEKHGASLTPWFMVERAALHARLGEGVEELIRQAFSSITPPTNSMPGKVAEERAIMIRWFDILDYLVMRHARAGEAATDLLAEYSLRLAQGGEQMHVWKIRLFRMLVVLDRGKELEARVREWTEADRSDSLWRVTLGYLLAERGDFEEAVELFEKVAELDELTTEEWQALADWYMALDRKEDREQAETKRLLVLDEYQLSNWLQNRLYQLQANEQGAQIEDRDIAIARALLEKAAYPGSYVWTVGELHRVTKDWRLFAALPEALPGHTPEQMYPALQNLSYQLAQVLDEATIDALVKAIKKARPKAKTDVDRRVLDLLEALAEGRAAMVQDQPGPHIRAAREALKRASKGEWLTGERSLMAQFLESLGAQQDKELAKLHMDQFWSLLEGSKKGSAERLAVAAALVRTLYAYGKGPKAIEVLTSELAAHHEIHGRYNSDASGVFSTLVTYLAGAGRYRQAEKLVRSALHEEQVATQRHWMRNLLFGLFQQAMSGGGTLSLGTGKSIYGPASKEIWAALEASNRPQIQEILRQYIYLLQAAHNIGIEEAKADTRTVLVWSLKNFRGLQPYEAHAMAGEVGGVVKQVLGAEPAFTYLLDVLDQQPAWFARTGQDGMNWHGYNLTQWRTEFKLKGKLEQRFLALLLKYLREDLETFNNRGCSSSYHSCGTFWTERQKDFSKVAYEVLKEHPKSAAILEHVAEYFAYGLLDEPAAIKILQKGWKGNLLTDNGLRRLVGLLISANRHKECLGPLKSLLKTHPTDSSLHAQMVQVLGKTKGKKAAGAYLKEAQKQLTKAGQWSEWVAAMFADHALQGELYEAADELYVEAIVIYRRNHPQQAYGDSTLAQYYRNQAVVRSRLGRTIAAVESASSAIVAWGSDRDGRIDSLGTLRQVLSEAKDLPAFIRHMEEEAASTGLENPLVRRMVAETLLQRGDCKGALVHLELLVGMDPDPVALHGTRVQAFDCLNQKEDARAALAEQILAAPYEFERYAELARRLSDDELEDEARRVLTGMVEVLPGEATSHRALAQAFQEEGPGAAAIVQWKHVVRLRGEDPQGYLDLARAHLKAGQLLQAGRVVAKLLSTDWHPDFSSVVDEARQLLEELGRMKK